MSLEKFTTAVEQAEQSFQQLKARLVTQETRDSFTKIKQSYDDVLEKLNNLDIESLKENYNKNIELGKNIKK